MQDVCINPADIQEGDWQSYVDGLASQSVIDHIRRCPACARQVEDLSRLQGLLAVALHRFSCPTSEQLIAYHQLELQGSEKMVVVQHLRQCPHCARDLAALARDERQSLGERLGSALQVLTAARLVPGVQAAPVRAGSGPGPDTPLVYRAGDVEFILTLRSAGPYARRSDLAGLVHVAGQVPEKIGDARVEFYDGEELIAITAISARGQFAFAALAPGGYDLCLLWADREIWLRGIDVP